MARTQAPDYDQRRQDIVTKAARLYASHGFLGASVADLALACDVSKSAIYHYYASKEDILFDVMHSHIIALDAATQDALASSDDARVQFRALARNFMQLYVGAADWHKVLINDLDNLPPSRRTEIIAIQRRLIGVVEQLLRDIEPSLAQRPGAARVAAMLFFGMINWTNTWFDPKGAVSADALADMAVDVTLGGLNRASAELQTS